jgi:hypothetical protein
MSDINDSMYMKGGNTDAEKAAFKLGFESALQTPSNEKYWRERCEAAEDMLEEIDKEITIRYCNSYQKWQQLKSTPIPIQTPCVELEKEVERLKGLLAGQAYSIWKGCDSDLSFAEWNKLFISGNNL